MKSTPLFNKQIAAISLARFDILKLKLKLQR